VFERGLHGQQRAEEGATSTGEPHSVSYQGLGCQFCQAYASQTVWERPNVYALVARINGGENWAPEVICQAGDTVSYQGVRYRASQGHESQPAWEPPNVPALWAVVP
jgi:hypothetical protein